MWLLLWKIFFGLAVRGQLRQRNFLSFKRFYIVFLSYEELKIVCQKQSKYELYIFPSYFESPVQDPRHQAVQCEYLIYIGRLPLFLSSSTNAMRTSLRFWVIILARVTLAVFLNLPPHPNDMRPYPRPSHALHFFTTPYPTVSKYYYLLLLLHKVKAAFSTCTV